MLTPCHALGVDFIFNFWDQKLKIKKKSFETCFINQQMVCKIYLILSLSFSQKNLKFLSELKLSVEFKQIKYPDKRMI